MNWTLELKIKILKTVGQLLIVCVKKGIVSVGSWALFLVFKICFQCGDTLGWFFKYLSKEKPD